MKPPFGLPDRMKSDSYNQEQTTSTHSALPQHPNTTSQNYSHLIPATPDYSPTHIASQPEPPLYGHSGFAAEDHNSPTVEISGVYPPGSLRVAQSNMQTSRLQANIPTHPLGGDIPPAGPPPKRPRRLPLPVTIIIVVLLIALSGGGVWALLNTFSKENQPATPTTVPTVESTRTPEKPANPVSSLLFGTNMQLESAQDQMLTSAKTRQLIQQLHTTILRVPMRNDGTLEPEIQALKMIKSLGIAPLVILHGEEIVDTALQDDTRLIQEANNIFGNSIVYYEYGNEEDLQGIDEQEYTASWNKIIPQLKKVARNGHFIGPVNFEYDEDYLRYFLQNANPRPDEVSWHEYTCDKSWAKERCIQNIDNWTRHISSARSMMKSTIGSELPIMITEWNYAPNASLDDGKITDKAFLQTWTSKAFKTLAANRIFASMFYAVTHPVFPLISHNDALTAQGSIFQNEYQAMIKQGNVPAAINNATVANQSTADTEETGDEKVIFSFEDGNSSNWTTQGSDASQVETSNTIAKSGQQSLKVSLDQLGPGDYPTVFGKISSQQPPHAGQSIAAYIYLTSNAVSLNAKMVGVDQNDKWHTGDTITLNPGKWTRVAYTLPSSFKGEAKRIGIQFNTPGNNATGAIVYIDNVGWN